MKHIFGLFGLHKLEVDMDPPKSSPSNHKRNSFSADALTLMKEYFQIGSWQSLQINGVSNHLIIPLYNDVHLEICHS